MLVLLIDAERTSMSPSPSKSVAKTETAIPTLFDTTRSVKLGVELPSLSYHLILPSWADAERTSVSPSPSRSVAKTEYAITGAVEITRRINCTSSPRTGSAPARLTAIAAIGLKTASWLNTAANNGVVTLVRVTRYAACSIFPSIEAYVAIVSQIACVSQARTTSVTVNYTYPLN